MSNKGVKIEMIYYKYFLFIVFLFITFMGNCYEAEFIIKKDINEKVSLFSFIGNAKLIYLKDKDKFSVIDLNNFKIIQNITIKDVLSSENIDCFNNQILYLKSANYPVLGIYDLNKNIYIDIDERFGKEIYYPYLQNYPAFWDYYGNNEEIIYEYNDILKNLEGGRFFGIYKKNIKTKKNTCIKDKARLIDYNKGLLLYFQFIENKDDINICLFDEKNNTTTRLNNLPDIYFNGHSTNAPYSDLKIYKDNNYLVKNKMKLAVIESKTGIVNDIKLKDDISVIQFKYSFDSDLIAIQYYKGDKSGFMIIKSSSYPETR